MFCANSEAFCDYVNSRVCDLQYIRVVTNTFPTYRMCIWDGGIHRHSDSDVVWESDDTLLSVFRKQLVHFTYRCAEHFWNCISAMWIPVCVCEVVYTWNLGCAGRLAFHNNCWGVSDFFARTCVCLLVCVYVRVVLDYVCVIEWMCESFWMCGVR